MRLRLLSVLVLGLCVMAYKARAAEEVKILELENLPANADPDDVKFLKEKQQKRQEVMAERKKLEEQLAAKRKELSDKRDELAKTQEIVTEVGGQEIKGPEPRSMEDVLNSVADKPDPNRRVRDAYELSPEDMPLVVQDRWSLNLTDFRFDRPQYITEDRILKAKKWWGFTFSITNTTPKTRRITPTFVAMTNKGVFNYSVGGFVPERRLADSLLRPLGDSPDLEDKELLNAQVSPLESQTHVMGYAFDPAKGAWKIDPQGNFEPGQTRWGAALWSNFSDDFTELKIVVRGLTNAYRYDDKLNYDDKDTEDHPHRIKETRALVLSFTRNADEFHAYSSELKFGEKRWEYLWAWDQCVNVPYPADAKDPQLKVMTLKTPAGAEKLAWAFPFTLNNPTRSSQNLAIIDIAFVCDVQVEAGGAKVPLEVRVLDDGRSSIYKAQVLKTLGKEAIKDRFQFAPVEEGGQTLAQRRKVTLEPAKALDETWAIFDEADVDWGDVKLQVESALTCALDKKAAAAQAWEKIAKEHQDQEKDLLQKNPGFLYDPRRPLSAEDFEQVKAQVLKALPEALEQAKSKKTVVAYFDCVSGMSTGCYRVKRCYAKPGVAEAGWLTLWDKWLEDWEKESAGGGGAAPAPAEAK